MNKQDQGALGFRLMDWVYRALLMAVLGIGCRVFNVLPGFPGENRCLILAVSYLFILFILQNVYRSCSYGQMPVSELVLSQTLAILLSAAIIYVSVALYNHDIFCPRRLIIVAMIQIAISCVWSISANRVWFRNHKPLRTAIIYGSKTLLDQLLATPYFAEKHTVTKLIENPESIDVLRTELDGCQALFTTGVSATLANGIAKLCVEKNIQGYFVPHLGHIIMSGAEYVSSFSIPVLHVQRAGSKSEYRMLKRLMDVCAALIGILVTLPIMLITAAAIKMEDHGPVLYCQTRLTKNGREFPILKFRSMSVNAEQDGVARLAGKNDSRVTKVGRFIRACRIDELPQLFNILLGDMSLVGPRPERPEIARQYEQSLPEFALRLQVKAGLTGMAQVYGRYNTEPYNKLQMDLMYINQMSVLTDLRLIAATIKILFVKDSTAGVAQGQATAMANHSIDKTA